MPREPPVTSARFPDRSFMLASQCLIDHVADDVLDAQMKLLRAIRTRGWNDDRMCRELFQRSTVASGKREDVDAARFRRFGRPKHVRRRPARRVDDQQITLLRERLDLP